MVEHDLPHYVRRKTAKGRTYYYFTMPSTDRARPRHIRLPDIADPLFDKRLAKLYGERKAPDRPKMKAVAERRVYFIGSDTGPIKIGLSRDPESRCRSMQTGSPHDVRVLATTPGGRRLEMAYHQRFGFAHVRGEWFNRHPEIMAEIERLQAEEQNLNGKTSAIS